MPHHETSAKTTRVAVLVSGGGTNLQTLLDQQAAGLLSPAEIAFVLSDRANAYALERAKKAGIPTMVLSAKDAKGDLWDDAALDALAQQEIELVVLAGFLRVLSPRFVAQYPGRILNIHPALLPSFGGKGYYGLHVHAAVLAHRVQVSGATVHIVDETPDGGPILAQRAVSVQPDDTPETLQKRIMQEAEWRLLPLAVRVMAERFRRGETGATLTAPIPAALLSDQRALARSGALVAGSSDEAKTVRKTPTLPALLQGNPYPGRGIAVATAPTGETIFAYFIMGRSANSRNRVFRQDGKDLYTEPYDPSKVEDPSLIIYRAIARNTIQGRPVTIVTNGDQTDTIQDALDQGLTFQEALMQRTFEPDGPNFTPRISLLVDERYTFSILKTLNSDGAQSTRQFFVYDKEPGVGRFISTYETDGAPLPSFQGEPLRFSYDGDAARFATDLWAALDPDNAIALYVEGSESFLFSRFDHAPLA